MKKKNSPAHCTSLIIACALFWAFPALANAKDGITFSIPQSPVHSQPPASDSQPHSPSSMKHTRIGLSYLTWKPTSVELYSHLPETSLFDSRDFPYLSVYWISKPSPLFPRLTTRIEYAWKAGIGFLNLSRSGVLSYSGVNTTETQKLYLLPLQLGIQLTPRFMQWNWGGFTAEFSLLPTWGITSNSVLAKSENFIATPFEISVGLEIYLSKAFEFEMSGLLTLGKFQSVSLAGSGLRAGIQIKL